MAEPLFYPAPKAGSWEQYLNGWLHGLKSYAIARQFKPSICASMDDLYRQATSSDAAWLIAGLFDNFKRSSFCTSSQAAEGQDMAVFSRYLEDYLREQKGKLLGFGPSGDVFAKLRAFPAGLDEGYRVFFLSGLAQAVSYAYDGATLKDLRANPWHFLSLGSQTPEQMWSSLLNGNPGGLCGDINGSFLKRAAHAMGFEHASIGVFEPGVGHVVGLLKGRQGYYMVNYGDAYSLGPDPDQAAEQAMIYSGRLFAPLGFSLDKRTFFYTPPSEQALRQMTGWMDGKLRKETGVSLYQDSNGYVGARAIHPYKDLTVGLFALTGPLALAGALGATLSFRGFDSERQPAGGAVWLPVADLAVMLDQSRSSRASYYGQAVDDPNGSGVIGSWQVSNQDNKLTGFLATARIEPFSYSVLPASNLEAYAAPLRLEMAYGGGLNFMPRLASRAGFIYHQSPFHKAYMDVTVGYARNDTRFYNFLKSEPAYQVEAGYETPDFSLNARAAPQSMLSRYELEGRGNVGLGPALAAAGLPGSLNFAAFAKITYLDGTGYQFGGQLSWAP